MSRRRKWAIAAAGVTVLALSFVVAWPEPEPRYQEKKLSEWLGGLLQSDRADHEAARAAVRHIGTNGLPWLLMWIDYEEAAWKRRHQGFVYRLPIGIRRWLLRREVLATEGMLAVQVLGPVASPAVPELTRLMNGGERCTSMRAIQALAAIGEPGVRVLVKALQDERRADRSVIVSSIVNLSFCPDDREKWGWLVPVFVKCLGDKDDAVVESSAAALGWLRLEPGLSVPALARLTGHPDSTVRSAGAGALEEFGADARAAVPDLMRCLGDPEARVRAEGTNALLKIAPEVLRAGGTNLAQ